MTLPENVMTYTNLIRPYLLIGGIREKSFSK